ncbi:MAG: sulfite exporter TauE/SafE family protein [Nevskia sp.]
MLLPILLGAVVGLILALTGAGGAIIAVPLLVFGLDWDVGRAAPVALLAVGAAAALGAVLGLRARIVRYRAATLIAAIGSLVTPLGLYLAQRLPAAPLALIFAAVLLFVALRLYRQASRELRGGADPRAARDAAACKLSSETGRFRWTALCTRALTQAGAVTGFLSGLLGVGGGFVIVPALRRSTDLPMNAVVATSLMAIALISLSTVTVSALAGRLDVAVAIPFALGAMAAMLAGRRVAARLSGPRLQQGFAVIAAVAALGLALRALT